MIVHTPLFVPIIYQLNSHDTDLTELGTRLFLEILFV